jgi:hypothetical protein
MSQHGRRAQKKLAKKKAKRVGKRARADRRDDAWMEAVLRDAGDWPIVETLVPDNLWAEGIGNLVIARRTPDGRLAVADFLVDTYCLGVKDAFCEVMSPIGYQALLANGSPGWSSTRSSMPAGSASFHTRTTRPPNCS